MNLTRPVVLAAVAASAVAVTSAHAAPVTKVKKSCNLVKDAAGDANGFNPIGSPVPTENAGPSDDSLDIRSVDVASDGKTLTGVVRVNKLAASDSMSPTGSGWQISFNAPGGQQFSLLATSDPSGAVTYGAGYTDPKTGSTDLYPGGTATGKFLPTKNQIHISVPLSAFAGQSVIRTGDTLTGLLAFSGQSAAIPDVTGQFGGGTLVGDTNPSDSAGPGKNYVVGTLSCVTPGR